MGPLIVILAAGGGTRLYPITEEIPKGSLQGFKNALDKGVFIKHS